MKTYMWSSISAMLALAMALNVSSSPASFIRRDDSDFNSTSIADPTDSNVTTIAVGANVAKYTLDDGSLDLGALIDDSAVTPIELPITATAATYVSVPTAALVASAAAEADVAYTTTVPADAAAATPAPSKRAVPAGTVGIGGFVARWDQGFCPQSQPGNGPVLNPDTTENFSGNQWLNQVYGQGAKAVAPQGYTKAFGPYNKFIQAELASISMGIDPNYKSYDPASCAAQCDRMSGCQSIAFWMGRGTDIDYYTEPQATDKQLWLRCNNPPVSRTNYVCAYLGARVTKDMATLDSQPMGPIFRTAIAALNVYFKNDPTVPVNGYTSAVNQAGIIDNGYTHKFLLDIVTPNSNNKAVGFKPDLCAANCDKRSDCAGFDSTAMYKDGTFAGTLCNLYSKTFAGTSQPAKGGQYTTSGAWVSTQPAVFYTKQQEQQ